MVRIVPFHVVHYDDLQKRAIIIPVARVPLTLMEENSLRLMVIHFEY